MSSSPATATASVVRKPLFEPTDILNFDFPTFTTPNAPNNKGKVKDKDNNEPQRENRLDEMDLDSPPPEYDEEPSDLEDELALMEYEREAEALKAAPVTEHKGQANGNGNEGRNEGDGLMPSDVLELEEELFGAGSGFNPNVSASASSSRTNKDFEPLPIFEQPKLSLYGPSNLPSLRAEMASGRIVTFHRRKRRAAPSAQIMTSRGSNAGDLLSVPLHRLLAEVEEMKSQQKAIKLQQRYDADAASKLESNGRSSKLPIINTNTAMWVDKYRPKKFSDLLGEERVHREVMGWLKEWDKCVFKRVPLVKKRRRDEIEGESFIVDPLGRPKERVLLLSGPPGYGKTTLAHIVAKHAGYRTLEINASDDRSAATVSTRIKNAIDAGTGLASEGKPTCVIIDEIDGASGGGDASFVRSLIKLIQDVPARKKSNTPARPLRRPIICICNDLYATSLRPLRQFARIIRFRKPQAQFLVKRLREICEREVLTADLRTLTMLVDITSGDVRSCLNTLQFIKSKSSTVSEEAIKSSSVGLKDSGTTLPSIWSSIFIPVAAKQRRKTSTRGGIDDGRYVDRLSFGIQQCGEYDKLIQGLFEHYSNVKPLDGSLGNLCKVHDWLGYYDSLSKRVNEEMTFELMGYMPYAITPWYTHLASPANNSKPTEWPKADYENYVTRTANEEISANFKILLPGILRSLFTPTTTMTELIPLLMRIISPPLKPVGANIVKPNERIVLSRLVEIMIPLGLKFWNEKGENGQPMMRLEPPIDVFIHYDGKRADDIAASRFAVRQLVAQAMDAEIARRRGAAATEGENAGGTDSLAKAYGLKGTSSGAIVVPDKAELPATDFFGRTVVLKPTISTSTNANGTDGEDCILQPLTKKKKPFRAVYKYNEGSSSAVRKTIKMSALM